MLVEQGVDFRLDHALAVPLLTIKGVFKHSFFLGQPHRHFFELCPAPGIHERGHPVLEIGEDLHNRDDPLARDILAEKAFK